jgi:hypothetical protein
VVSEFPGNFYLRYFALYNGFKVMQKAKNNKIDLGEDLPELLRYSPKKFDQLNGENL